ncbi:uncharacterized protein LOC135205180 [Macrobrachium nipponense]|uniref:uncharacterized protein LOC135205180 n=1 Tax=Macrobrachium nipponense TaxID=159736 RepID=UPI0030C7EC4E
MSPKHIKSFPFSVEVRGQHNHSTEVAEGLNELRVSASTKVVFEQYFEQAITAPQAHRHHVLKMDLCDDIYGQAHHAINPSKRAIQYMFDVWRKRKHGGLNTPIMFDAIQKYAENNPEIILRIEHSQGSFCMILITPFMMRAHRQLKEAGEVVFVDATSCVDQLNTVIIPFLCSGPAGAVPLALVFTSSQDGATVTKG